MVYIPQKWLIACPTTLIITLYATWDTLLTCIFDSGEVVIIGLATRSLSFLKDEVWVTDGS